MYSASSICRGASSGVVMYSSSSSSSSSPSSLASASSARRQRGTTRRCGSSAAAAVPACPSSAAPSKRASDGSRGSNPLPCGGWWCGCCLAAGQVGPPLRILSGKPKGGAPRGRRTFSRQRAWLWKVQRKLLPGEASQPQPAGVPARQSPPPQAARGTRVLSVAGRERGRGALRADSRGRRVPHTGRRGEQPERGASSRRGRERWRWWLGWCVRLYFPAGTTG